MTLRILNYLAGNHTPEETLLSGSEATKGPISGKIAKDVLVIMFNSGRDAADIVEERGLKQVTDTGTIEGEIDKVFAANPDRVIEYHDGKEKILGWFVGQVMQATRGKANPKMVNQLLLEKLKT